jgi:hypothetical protein
MAVFAGTYQEQSLTAKQKLLTGSGARFLYVFLLLYHLQVKYHDDEPGRFQNRPSILPRYRQISSLRMARECTCSVLLHLSPITRNLTHKLWKHYCVHYLTTHSLTSSSIWQCIVLLYPTMHLCTVPLCVRQCTGSVCVRHPMYNARSHSVPHHPSMYVQPHCVCSFRQCTVTPSSLSEYDQPHSVH